MDIKKAGILLVPNEKAYYTRFNMPPLPVGIIQSYLKENGLEVQAVDLNVNLQKKRNQISRDSWKEIFDRKCLVESLVNKTTITAEQNVSLLLEDVKLDDIDIFGISIGSSFSFFEIHTAFLIGKWLKNKFSKPVVFGGDNIQFLVQFKEEFKETLDAILRNFEYIFIGPGEKALVELIQNLNGKAESHGFKELPGAIYRKDGQIIANAEDTPTFSKADFTGLDLDYYKVCVNRSEPKDRAKKTNEIYFYKWPYPQTLLASNVNRYKLTPENREEKLFIPYIFNYNCPYKCTFCVQSRDDKPKVSSKRAEDVVDDIEKLVKEYNTPYFYFFNNTFNYSSVFVRKFCDLVIERKLEIYWSDCARFNNLDENLVQLMYRAGCRKLVFGFETGSEKLLKYIDKKLDLEHGRQVLEWCHKAGIWADIEIILGLPYEFEEDYQQTVDFIEQNIKNINFFNLNKYFVVPVSLLGKYPEKYGLELIKVKNRYDLLLEKAYQKFIKSSGDMDDKSSISVFQMYRFNEANGRGHEEITLDTNNKFKRFKALYSKLGMSGEVQLFKIFELAALKKNLNVPENIYL